MIDFKKLPQVHDPQEIEEKIYEWWESQGYFRPEKQRELNIVNEKSLCFCITLPPPNVTGVLHTGHALTLTIEDLMTRFERMCQKETLFLPGTDHAGIATQNVVERELAKKGVKRKEIGREKFLEEIWKWKEKCNKIITDQTKSLGVSCDWSRERFTMDKNYQFAVVKAFVDLYKKGLIYRGNYMVNWCSGRCKSAISNLEAIPEEHDSFLWYIRYPVINSDWMGPKSPWGSGDWAKGATDFIEIATTRPETLLGDSGIAVALDHSKYKKHVGKKAVLPVNEREVPIFEDSYVDPEFGTGALKITPAHDPNDYEIGLTHNLEFITVLDEDANMIPEYSGIYAHMDRYECRNHLVKDLEKEGLLVKVEPYRHSVDHCQRCHTVIEPRISTQWFVKTKPLAEAAIKTVKNRDTVMIPEREELRFHQWMDNIKDWCISRQLWWGHRIPVWYCPNNHEVCALEKPPNCPTCKDSNLTQDEDVLDTWFSSGLWPFATLNWPNTEDFDYLRYYPTNYRETAYDILFFWVAREMMLGIELTGVTPYHKVYLHGIIRDEQGKKISKSMENIDEYDPLNIIAKYGADPFRFTLVTSTIPGKDMNLSNAVLKASKNFCNKIWQSANFVTSNLDRAEKIIDFTPQYPIEKLKIEDLWILSRLNKLVKQVSQNYEQFEYLDAARSIRSFYWDYFCDWYIEVSKIRLYNESESDKNTPIAILLHVLDTCLRLLHPIIPFLTEALWQTMPDVKKDGVALIIAKWPKTEETLINDEIEQDFELITMMVHEIRRVRKEFNVKPGLRIPIIIETGEKRDLIEQTLYIIASLAHIDNNQIRLDDTNVPKHSARIVIQDIIIFLPLKGIIDLNVEIKRISKQIEKLEEKIRKSEKKLDGPFAQKANPDVVQKEREMLTEIKAKKKNSRRAARSASLIPIIFFVH